MAGRITLVTQGWRKKQAALWDLLITQFTYLNTMFTELFPNIQAVTATSDGLTTGLITAGKNFITVTSADANNQITLPASSVGTVIKILVGATGCELVCATAGDKINDVVCGATNEAALTDKKDAPFIPGEKQCMYCPHRGNCSAAATWTMEKSGVKFGPIPSASEESKTEDPTVMPDEKLAQLVESAPMLRKLLEAAEGEAVRRISSGHPVTGLKVVRGSGRREWVKTEEEIALRLKQMGMPKDQIWRVSLVSPAQVEKAEWKTKAQVEKKLTEKQLAVLANQFIGKSEGKLTAVPVSDPRSGVDFGVTESMFKPIGETPDWLK